MSKEEEWKQHFEQQAQSGLSHAGYCRREGIKDKQYFYWKRKFSGSKEAGSFVPVGKLSDCLELCIGEVSIKVPAGFQQSELKRVLELLC